MNGKITTNSELGVLDVIGIIFITLKIIGVEPVVGWPWWIVLSPLWIYIGALALIAVLAWCVKDSKKETK